jgi:tripartite-type tricarboxylate transporter receptor subunit TctC
MSGKKAVIAAAVSAVVTLAGCGGQEQGAGGGTDAGATDYPSESMTLIVPYAAGGPTDTVARAIAPFFEEELGQTVVVENKTGGSGAIGMQEMIQSEPDGHTLQLVASTAAVVTPLVEDVGYGIDDFTTVGAVTQYPYVLAVNADSPYEDAEEFFAAAKAKPGKIKVGTPGASSQGAVELQRMKEEYDLDIGSVPFGGNAELNTALLGGNVDGIFLVASQDVLEQVESGKFRALAVGSEDRADYLADVPTLKELGYEEIDLATSYYGLAVPVDTPEDVVQTLEDTLEAALEDSEVVERVGENYVPEEFIDGAKLRERFAAQKEVYEPILAQ